MTRRHKKHIPKIWLMTDPRFGDGLIPAIQKLPAGSGVIFRHYDLAEHPRRKLLHAVAKTCRRRGHLLLIAGNTQTANLRSVQGIHGRALCQPSKAIIRSAPVHNVREITQAVHYRADILLLSPCRSTASHPGARPLGMLRFMQLARLCKPTKVIALGGMTHRRFMMMDARAVYGWAAIDAFR